MTLALKTSYTMIVEYDFRDVQFQEMWYALHSKIDSGLAPDC